MNQVQFERYRQTGGERGIAYLTYINQLSVMATIASLKEVLQQSTTTPLSRGVRRSLGVCYPQIDTNLEKHQSKKPSPTERLWNLRNRIKH